MIKKIILYNILLALSYVCFATNIDSIQIEIKKLRYSNPDSALQIISLFDTNLITIKQKAIFNKLKADIYWYKGDYKKSLKYYNKNIVIYKQIKDTINIGGTYADIGYVYMDMKNYVNALKYYQDAFDIAKKMNDSELIYLSTTYKGQLNQALNQPEKTLQAYFDALNSELGRKSNKNKAILYNNIAGVYSSLSKYDEALKYSDMSWEIWKELNDKNGEANYCSTKGEIYKQLNNIEQAEEYLLRAEQLNTELGKKAFLSEVYLALFEIYSKKENHTRSIEYKHKLESVLKISENLNIKENFYLLLSEYFKKNNRMDSAFFYLKQHNIIKDSVLDNQKQEQLNLLSAQFDSDKKEYDIKLLKAEHEHDLLLIKQRNLQLYITFGGGIIFLILLLVAYRNYKVAKKANKIITNQNNELNATNHELAIQRDEIKKQKQVVDEAHREIKASFNYAKRIQSAILPNFSDIQSVFNQSFVLYLPKDVVAGDFYWFEQIQTSELNTIFIAAADCTGHGVPGAMVSVICSNALNKALLEEKIVDTGKLLDRTRELVVERLGKGESEIKDGMDISLLKIMISNSGEIECSWSGANNPLYWFKRASELNSDITIFKGDRQPIGISANPTPFVSHLFTANKGDMFYLFTDGFADQFGKKTNKKLSNNSFRKLLSEISSFDTEKQKEMLEEFFLSWKQDYEQIDDICVLGIRL